MFKSLSEFKAKVDEFLINDNHLQQWSVTMQHDEYGRISVKITEQNKTSYSTDLCNLFFKYGSDKGGGAYFDPLNTDTPSFVRVELPYGNPGEDKFSIKVTNHNFSRFYHKLFKENKEKKLNIFEMGIGVDNALAYSKSAGSLSAWKEYFSNSNIFGADIEPALIKDKEIKTFVCDQTNNKQVKEMFKKINKKFNLILDDGLHCPDGNYSFFCSAYPFLKKGGVYIVEDVCLTEEENQNLASRHMKNLELIRKEYKPRFAELINIVHNNGTDNNLLVVYK
jgi:hypothetical protein